jgi:LuxR family maltose regulon positive regulatory protein
MLDRNMKACICSCLLISAVCDTLAAVGCKKSKGKHRVERVMPKRSFHRLLWSAEQQRYELSSGGNFQQCFTLHDEQNWLNWLGEQTSFAFHGRCGHLSVVKEERARGGSYWYAYGSGTGGRRKHYLGPTPRVTLARLEEEAGAYAAFSSLPWNKTQETLIAEHEAPFRLEVAPSALFSAPVAPLQQMPLPLPASKLSPPQLAGTLIERERLHARLEEALDLPLTLLSASGGWGKTTLLAAWARRQSRAIAWLSLDETENILARFWSAVIAALRTCHASIGATALTLLYSPQPVSIALVLTSLLNEVASLKGTTVLVLDDYHLIADAAIHESVLYALEHLPPNLRLVLSTRVDPPFPLARLRLRGQMSEIRDLDLRFLADDTRHFLVQRMGLPLSETEVAILESRTEGWIAGLQLAALAMRQREDHAAFVQTFSGSHRYVLDYFQDDILAYLPPAAQEFLLQTAILSRLHAPLCQAVTGETACQELLEELERENLFLVPLDEERRWYRFHELFRQTLLARLTMSYPERLPVLHLRAAHWYEVQGDLRAAIAHALSAEDFVYAADLMEHEAEAAWTRGEARTVHEWIEMLPDEIVRVHASFALTAALRLLHTLFGALDEQQQAAVGHTIDRVERLIHEEVLTEAEQERLYKRVQLFHLWSVASQSILVRDMAQLQQCGEKMLPLVREDEIIWQMAPLFVNVISCMNGLGACDVLKTALLTAGQQAEKTQQRYEWLRIREWLVLILWETGEVSQAERECRMLLSLLQLEWNQQTSIEGYLSLTLARICWACNRCEEAFSHLTHALALAQSWQYRALLAECFECRVIFALERGQLDEAELALQMLRRQTQESGIAIRLPREESVQVRLWLAQGDHAAVEAWTAQIHVDQDRPIDVFCWETSLTLARLRLAQHAYATALPILERLVSHAERGQRLERMMQGLALQVVALAGLKEREQARELTIRLLQVAQPGGLVRVFLQAGGSMRRTLQQLYATHATTLSREMEHHLALVLDAFEQEEWESLVPASLQARQRGVSLSSDAAPAHSVLHEPLSSQELRVLRLLVAGRTYAEMARELIVSPNTIKTQVSSIYRKLGVNRRAEASLIAQQFHLL